MSSRCFVCGGTDPNCTMCEGTGEIADGFRPRKRRGRGWLAKAIKDGSVRDPNAPDPDAGADYSGAVVVRPPTATLDAR